MSPLKGADRPGLVHLVLTVVHVQVHPGLELAEVEALHQAVQVLTIIVHLAAALTVPSTVEVAVAAPTAASIVGLLAVLLQA
jgi:hypothetical protein